MEPDNTLTITLTVDTAKIQPGKVDDYISFSDGQEHPKGQKPEEFTSEVKKNMEVEWIGIPKDEKSGDLVTIKKVNWEKDAKILREKDHHGNKGKVKARVKEEHVPGEEKYSLHFSVTYKDQKTQNFPPIDPKLTMAKEA